MNNYYKFIFEIEEYEEFKSDLLSAGLAEAGFESFVTIEDKLEAFIPSEKLDIEKVDECISFLPVEMNIKYEFEEIESLNWNEEWEKNYFEPIIIADKCVIHSSFHKNIPQLEYSITIDPKMAFGTGHHETTSLMIAEILKMDFQGKSVLDMGCGTAVLAILAKIRGASECTAVDIDDWCTENSIENIAKNKITGINVILGGAEQLENKLFNIIIANINRNILLQDMDKYYRSLIKGGELYMSGFYIEDIPVLEEKAMEFGLKLQYFNSKNNWAIVKMK